MSGCVPPKAFAEKTYSACHVRPEVGYNSDPERVHEVLLAVVARPDPVTAGIGEPDSA